MKKIILSLSVFLTVLLLSSSTKSSEGQPVLYKLAASSSTLSWKSTSEDGTTHKGNIKFKSGNAKWDSQTLLSAYSLINMQSITCTDIKDEGFNRELIVSMRSAEELNLQKYKDASFKITKAKRLYVEEGKPNYEVKGTFKLKDKIIPISFTATIKKSKKTANTKGSFTLSKEDTKLPYDLEFTFSTRTDLKK